ncbi:hypothetical protein SAMN05443634_103165 [Chishuiella changwenlii]|uniref:DUF6850 domain-containing protein n=1 Tax=Chishuiella changwenlii TaxID=1434701 RepID=A0A1M6V2Q9_9FLAO|nr:DUF6850 family outer membrane beta-barrel protein [Chishuiella changwenlii]GGF02000.1 hypothetical protein GCM10010984_19350 [Chishuiella changwenlii]SHK75740.1 hypothetical protein SAMN05443634_103165 [Chishuiella changwenlii]
MLKTLKIFQIFLITLCFCSITKAQDSLSLFQNFKNQYDAERDFKQQIYYNPANMLDYSSSSFSELNATTFSQKDKVYRQQKGSGEKGFGVFTNSFQKLNDRKVIWGNASYENLKLKQVKWNENLDFDRVAPYISSDSVGGDIDVERYQFLGGYAQRFNKLSFGAQIGYQSQLGSRSRDPRLNNTTSELKAQLGLGYNFYKNLALGAFVEGYKYQQNSSTRFVSQLGQPLVYQMTGLGIYNNLFSGGSSILSTVNEEYSYKVGGKISNRNSQDFYILAQFGQSAMERSYRGSGNRFFYVGDLDKDLVEVEGAKFFQFNQNRVGLKVNYFSRKTKGIEYGYSNNTQLISLIYKRLSYKRDEEATTFSLFYSLNKEKFRLSFIPYYSFQEITEQRVYPNSGQKFQYNNIGASIDYVQQIATNQTLSFRPFFDYKSVSSAKNALSRPNEASINTWILNDFNYLASDITTIGANLRYDIKLEKLPTMFVSGNFIQSKIQSKNNNYSSLSVGIIF